MKKRDKIIYWIATIWLGFGMAFTGVIQLIKTEQEVKHTSEGLGYPVYFLTILGVWKLLGVVAILLPRFPLMKEWAYAGFFFSMTGAIFSHNASGSVATEYIGPSILIVLTVLSWYFRPADKKLIATA